MAQTENQFTVQPQLVFMPSTRMTSRICPLTYLHCAKHCPAGMYQMPLSQLHHHTAIRKSDLKNKYCVFVHGKQSAHRNHISFTPLYTGVGGKLHLQPYLPWAPTDWRVAASLHQHPFTFILEQSGMTRDLNCQSFGLHRKE